jgi:modulator of FtsH protease HflK
MAWDWEKLQHQRTSRPGGPPPQMDDILGKFKDMKGKFGGIWVFAAGLFVLILGYSMFYTVAVDEVGVVQRFGKYVRTSSPGLNFKLPVGIEKVTNVPVRHVSTEEFGFRTITPGIKTEYASDSAYLQEALMLTGDLNVAVVPWIVQYRISDPYKYLFKVHDVKATLRDLSEATMRLVVGDRSINEVISKRDDIAVQAKDLLQKELDIAETGIFVTTIEMKKTNVPELVQPSFNEVNQAVQEKEKSIYEAREAYNKLIPQAKGSAEKTVKESEGYALDRVNKAKGDSARFMSLYQEYVKAKDVTRRRLYLEAMRELFPRMGSKYIVDSNQKNLVPLLNMGIAGQTQIQSQGETPVQPQTQTPGSGGKQ